MEKKKIEQIFIRFLKENCALADYRTHIGDWDGRLGPPPHTMKTFYELFNSMTPDDWINYAFAWENTELGRNRWLYLSDEWAIILSKTKRIKK